MSVNHTNGDHPKPAVPTYQRVVAWFVSVLVPVALVLGAVRLMLTPGLLRFEYGLSNFPPDRYGFTQAERLYWSRFALDYLLNSADISYLGDLRFEHGDPLFNQRELDHMVDVKVTVKYALWVWYASLGLLLAFGVWAWLGKWSPVYLQGLSRGGFLTSALLAAIILFVLVSFSVIFVAFHNIFFAAGTWLFEYSDTLIRLFPERFWQDIFIYVGIFSIFAGLLLGFGLRRKM